MGSDARTVRVDQWQCMLVLSKTYSSITIGLIKLVRVEYVLGRQIESIHYLISRSKCMQCKCPKARQSRDPDWCVQGTSKQTSEMYPSESPWT